MTDASEFEIVKVRWCRKCERAGTPARMVYAGTQRISSTIQIVAFKCACGHRNNENLKIAEAQKLIKECKLNGTVFGQVD